MALTPEDVQKKLFTTVRLREGYETSEVDEFCEEVETELTRLRKENDDLRTQVTTAPSAEVGAGARRVSAGEGDPVGPRTPPPPEIVVRTSEEVSAAAARVLEMAQRTADQYLSEVRAEAELLVTEARSSAEQLSTDAQTKADEVDRATHERTTALERELAEERQTTLERLQEDKRKLESQVETLRSFEREYRGRLRTFLEGQLGQLSAHGSEDTPLAPAGGPRGVTSGEEQGASGAPAADTSTQDSAAESSDPEATERPAGPDGATPGEPDASVPDTAVSDGGADGDRRADGGPRSALGRILAEEERAARDS